MWYAVILFPTAYCGCPNGQNERLFVLVLINYTLLYFLPSSLFLRTNNQFLVICFQGRRLASMYSRAWHNRYHPVASCVIVAGYLPRQLNAVYKDPSYSQQKSRLFCRLPCLKILFCFCLHSVFQRRVLKQGNLHLLTIIAKFRLMLRACISHNGISTPSSEQHGPNFA